MQCGAVCCSVSQCVVFCGVPDVKWMCASSALDLFLWCSVLQCVAVCCSVLQCVAVCCGVLHHIVGCCSVVQRVAVCCCSVLQCVAQLCSVLQCVAHTNKRSLLPSFSPSFSYSRALLTHSLCPLSLLPLSVPLLLCLLFTQSLSLSLHTSLIKKGFTGAFVLGYKCC